MSEPVLHEGVKVYEGRPSDDAMLARMRRDKITRLVEAIRWEHSYKPASAADMATPEAYTAHLKRLRRYGVRVWAEPAIGKETYTYRMRGDGRVVRSSVPVEIDRYLTIAEGGETLAA